MSCESSALWGHHGLQQQATITKQPGEGFQRKYEKSAMYLEVHFPRSEKDITAKLKYFGREFIGPYPPFFVPKTEGEPCAC